MPKPQRSSRPSFVVLCALVMAIVLHGCSCDSAPMALAGATNCISQHLVWANAGPQDATNTMPGTVQAFFSGTESGAAAISVPLDVVPGHGAPNVATHLT